MVNMLDVTIKLYSNDRRNTTLHKSSIRYYVLPQRLEDQCLLYDIGSLFNIIGGFPPATIKVGITTLWASEIEAAPISITKRHFPNMRHLGEITLLHGAEIEPAYFLEALRAVPHLRGSEKTVDFGT